MKYHQERKASEEILRLIIQKMAVHPAAFTPHTYTVWYEYVMGINSGLSLEMDKLLQENRMLEDDCIWNLYQDHVSQNGKEDKRIHEEIRDLLGKVMAVTSETDRQTVSFGNTLQDYGDQLRTMPDRGILDKLLDRMAKDAESMHGSMNHLHSELEHSRDEIEKLHKELDSARQEALIDPLTKVYNRRGFEINARKALAACEPAGGDSCILMLDIDHFKKVNDTYGHIFGDKVICAIANTLRSTVKGQDIVARLGGEEFAVLLPETPLDGGRTVAEHIRSGIERGRIKGTHSASQSGSITVSVGIAAHHGDKSLVDSLDEADKALYISKKTGRNRITVYGQQI